MIVNWISLGFGLVVAEWEIVIWHFSLFSDTAQTKKKIIAHLQINLHSAFFVVVFLYIRKRNAFPRDEH